MTALVASMILSSSPAPDNAVSAALYSIGRTGLMPDGTSPAEFLASAPGLADTRLAAWAAWSAGLPLESGPALEMLEFGAGEPADAAGLDPSGAVEALALRAMHIIASGEQPPTPELLDSLVSRNAALLEEDALRLVLQLFGRLGLVNDALPEACRRPDRPALYASWLRYCSEAGIAETPPGLHCLPYPARLYAARLAGPEDAAALLSDSIWAVRYEAAGRCDPGRLESLLRDEVPYVALRAATLMKDAGVEGWHEAAVRLSGLEGPVGFQAATLLDSTDAGLLRTLLSDPQAARRLSAQQVWLGAGLPVDEEMETSWLRDPYWIIPVSYLEALSGRGDSTRAMETARAMLETRDDRDLRQGLAAFLGIELPEGTHEPRLPVDADTLTAVRAVIDTDQGEVVVELMTDIAPVTCATFAWLAGSGFYDGIWFHRVIPGFVAQAGCPQGNGYGGPGFSIPNERSPERFTRGVVGMADAGLDTGGSQFFIMLDDHDRLDCRYTAFGRVIGGEETIDRITVGTLIREVRIEHVVP